MNARFHRLPAVIAAALVPALFLMASAMAQPETSPRAELRRGDFHAVEHWLNAFQSPYESGRITDVELRDAYRRLYNLDDGLAEQLKSWAGHRPNSYAAHFLLGVHYKHLGDVARGGEFIQKTPRDAITEMRRWHDLAMGELQLSTRLTAKPYLSWFIMLGIAQDEGTLDEKRQILDQAVRLDKVAELVRVRYMTTLRPRWGGSLPLMEAFIARSRGEGMPDRVIRELQAIEEEDRGVTQEDLGDDSGARLHFEKSLALAVGSAPFFLADALPSAQRVLCMNASVPSANCPH